MQSAYSCLHGEGVSCLMCTYALTLSLFVFLAAFLCYSVFICRNLTIPLLKKYVFVLKWLFFSNEINYCRHEISFFHLKLFLL